MARRWILFLLFHLRQKAQAPTFPFQSPSLPGIVQELRICLTPFQTEQICRLSKLTRTWTRTQPHSPREHSQQTQQHQSDSGHQTGTSIRPDTGRGNRLPERLAPWPGRSTGRPAPFNALQKIDHRRSIVKMEIQNTCRSASQWSASNWQRRRNGGFSAHGGSWRLVGDISGLPRASGSDQLVESTAGNRRAVRKPGCIGYARSQGSSRG
jgi:hypothetical protein